MFAVDIGNTNASFCKFEEDEAVWFKRIETAEIDYSVIEEIISDTEIAGEEVYIASVVKPVNKIVCDVFEEAEAAKVDLLAAGQSNIIAHNLATIETTGVDRLLTALSGKTLFPEEALVMIQAGTAVTVDYVSKEGIFQGGMIMPGPGMWLDSLTGAAMLPQVDFERLHWEKNGAGDGTEAAILNGVSAGIVGAVKEAVRRMVMLSSDVPQIVLTGGWAEALEEFFPASKQDDLVLTGLYIYAHTCGS